MGIKLISKFLKANDVILKTRLDELYNHLNKVNFSEIIFDVEKFLYGRSINNKSKLKFYDDYSEKKRKIIAGNLLNKFVQISFLKDDLLKLLQKINSSKVREHNIRKYIFNLSIDKAVYLLKKDTINELKQLSR